MIEYPHLAPWTEAVACANRIAGKSGGRCKVYSVRMRDRWLYAVRPYPNYPAEAH